MKFATIAFAAIIGIMTTSSVYAEEQIIPAAVISTESAAKQYVVTFHDDISTEAFEETSKWIKENNGEVLESINENFAKLMIVKMSDSIMKLSELKPKIVESVEEDDLEWDEHAEL